MKMFFFSTSQELNIWFTDFIRVFIIIVNIGNNTIHRKHGLNNIRILKE